MLSLFDGRTCCKCGYWVPLTDYPKGRYRCRPCNNEDQRERSRQEADKRKAYRQLPHVKARMADASRRWRDANPDRYTAQNRRNNRKFAVLHADQRQYIKNKRRARTLAAPGSYTRQEWEALCAKYDNRCLCCKQQKRLTIDHVIPLARGGSNSIDNLQPLCRLCNSRKWAKHIDYRPLWE